MTAWLFALAVGAGAPQDEGYRAALDLFYDGSTHAAQARLVSLAEAHPDDPMGRYYQALVLCWLIELRGGRAPELEEEFERHVNAALAMAEARLERDPADLRARLGRGSAHGVRSRLALFRNERRQGTRDAVRMREALLDLQQRDPGCADAAFGLGLYDYYADVLPRLLKVLRFVLWIPGGDRERGLARIEDAAHGPGLHRVEARVQLYEIHAFYEDRPDRALEHIRELRRLYPGSPVWGLRLTEHLRERMGLYGDSAAVAEELIEAAEQGRPNYAPVVGAMARVYLGEALLLDLRLDEARRAVAPVLRGVPEAAWVTPRAQMVVGRSLEIEGDARGAEWYYRAAAAGPHRESRERAEDALDSHFEPGELHGLRLLAEARRLAEAGRAAESEQAARRALRVWPDSKEAALRVADADLDQGRVAAARHAVERLAQDDAPEPRWLRPWSRLLLAQLHDLRGDRPAAVREYKKVWQEPCGREDLRRRAAEGLRRPFTRAGPRPVAPDRPLVF